MIHKVLFEDDGKLSIEDIRMGMTKVGKIVNKIRMFAILDKDGKFVSEYEYEDLRRYSEGYAVVAKNLKKYSTEKGNRVTKGEYGVVDRSGKLMIPLVYEGLGECKEGLINAKKNEKWGFIRMDGEVAIPFEFDEAHPFSEGLASVKKNGKFGFIDKNGEVVIDFKFIWTHDFSDDVCFVQFSYASAESSLRYIDKSGNIAIRIHNDVFGKYGMPSDYNNGVMVLNRFKAVGKDGSVKFDLGDRYLMKQFQKGISCVFDTQAGLYGFVDTQGEFIVPCRYKKCLGPSDNPNTNGMIGVMEVTDKWGVIGFSGEEILPAEYDRLHGYSDGRVLVTKSGTIYSITI